MPTCPHCGDMILQARRQPGTSYLVFAEPAPIHCDGPEHHSLGPGRMLTGWTSCECPGLPHHGHRLWSCTRCPSEQCIGLLNR